jgi:hypothetical protein
VKLPLGEDGTIDGAAANAASADKRESGGFVGYQRPDPIIDPRGIQPRSLLNFAPRLSMEELKERGRILFYDNTKLGFCDYIEVYNNIQRRMAERGFPELIYKRETVRGKLTEHLRKTAQALASEGFDAAILALSDMGTSAATAVLTIELEKAGVPAVMIGAPPGAQLAEQLAFYRAGRLCRCHVDIYQGSTVPKVAAETDKIIDCIIDSLTKDAKELQQRFTIETKMDSEPPTGLLHIPVAPNSPVGATPGLYMEEVLDLFDALSMGDGLPVIPATQERVDAMMAYCPWDRDEVLIGEAGPSGKDITVKDVVVNAVLAGCKAQYVPILITAFRAMSDPRYNFLQSVTTSHAGGNLILVSGPMAQELKIHGGQGCLGPGFRANATIGRAVNLTILNACRAVPGKTDLGCLASPAEYSYCFAEDPMLSPWPLINEERYDPDTTTVYVLKADSPSDVIDFLSRNAIDLFDTFISSSTCLGKNNAYIAGNLMLLMTPDHAKLAHEAGFDKDKIRRYFHERVHNPKALVEGRGLVPVRPPGFDQVSPILATRSPSDIEVVVLGGRGGHSAVVTPWGLHSEAIVEAVRRPDGQIARAVEDFKAS